MNEFCATKEKAGVITRVCTPETGADGLPLKVGCERNNVTEAPVTFCFCDTDNCNHDCAAVKCEPVPLAKKNNYLQLFSLFNPKKESPTLVNPYLQHCEAKCNAGGSLEITTKGQAEEGDGTPSKGNVQEHSSTHKVNEGEGGGKTPKQNGGGDEKTPKQNEDEGDGKTPQQNGGGDGKTPKQNGGEENGKMTTAKSGTQRNTLAFEGFSTFLIVTAIVICWI